MLPTSPSLASSPRVAVLGGGITGLTAAWHLRRAGFSPQLFEKSPRVGGAIGTLRTDGWLHELGPNSFLEGSVEVAAFIDQLGLGARRVYASPAAKQRYIVRRGALVAMPTSPVGFVGTPLFSLRAKLGLCGEPWRRRSDPNQEETVADFVLRRLGRDFLDYAVDPFVGGVYAGDPARLSVRQAFPKLHALEQEHGSLLRGAWNRRNLSGGPKGRIFSFPQGLAELPATIARELGEAVRLRTRVDSLHRTPDGWLLVGEDGISTWQEEFAAVVCALPADAVAALRLVGVPGPNRLETLREIDHPPVASVFTGYRRGDVRHPLDGFGLLMPRVERRSILGTLFSSTLFDGRAPDGHVALTTFIGGRRNAELAWLDDDAFVDLVQREHASLLGVSAPPVFTHVQRCPRAIPQYAIGHQEFKDTVAAVETLAPGLFIGGNFRDGISLTHCVEGGRRLAAAVVAQVPRLVTA